MNSKPLALLILFCLPLLSLTTAATAGGNERMMVKIPHEFTAGTILLPAGRYSVSVEPGPPLVLHLHDRTGEACAHLTVITRLAQHAGGGEEQSMVFDRVGGQHLLSEVWLSGEDGYLLLGTPKEHSHEIIRFGG